jgi:hypothetical protein
MFSDPRQPIRPRAAVGADDVGRSWAVTCRAGDPRSSGGRSGADGPGRLDARHASPLVTADRNVRAARSRGLPGQPVGSAACAGGSPCREPAGRRQRLTGSASWAVGWAHGVWIAGGDRLCLLLVDPGGRVAHERARRDARGRRLADGAGGSRRAGATTAVADRVAAGAAALPLRVQQWVGPPCPPRAYLRGASPAQVDRERQPCLDAPRISPRSTACPGRACPVPPRARRGCRRRECGAGPCGDGLFAKGSAA